MLSEEQQMMVDWRAEIETRCERLKREVPAGLHEMCGADVAKLTIEIFHEECRKGMVYVHPGSLGDQMINAPEPREPYSYDEQMRRLKAEMLRSP